MAANWSASGSRPIGSDASNSATNVCSLNASRWLELSFDELSLYRLAFQRILESRIGLHILGNRAAKSMILPAICSKRCQVSLQAAFFSAPPTEVALDGLVQKLIDGPPFELAEGL
jgi:hypothetical protein